MAYSIDTLPDQDGRVVIVTGANTGLGFHNAKDLASKGATVVMACRTASRGESAREKILDAVPRGDLRVMTVDLSSLESVRAFAATFREEVGALDVLINNAGIMATPRQTTVDGFEEQMAANYWGHHLLTSLLFDLLPDDAASRVVTLSSIAHIGASIRWDDIHWERHYDARRVYGQTKVACLMFALELDRRLRDAGRAVRSIGAHPGVSLTDLARHWPRWQVQALKYTIGPFISHAPDRASRPTLLSARDPGIEGGDYIGPQGINEMRGDPGDARIDSSARDEESNRRLWDLSVELTGADWPF